jgi:hypothetical protein
MLPCHFNSLSAMRSAVSYKLYETACLVPCGIFRFLRLGGPVFYLAASVSLGSPCGRKVRNVVRSVGEFDTLDGFAERRTQSEGLRSEEQSL